MQDCAHLITVSIPASKSTDHNLAYLVSTMYPALFSFTFFRMSELLSFGCGLTPGTLCLPISDVSHHHLALGFLIIFLTTISSQLKNCVSYRLLGYAQRSTFTYGAIDSGIESYHGKLSLSLSVLGSLTSLLAQHTYSLCPYPLLSLDPTSSLALYTNHQYIAALLLTGSLVHAGLAFIDD
jgi:photosystem I P700 chlorophyll a apoprotein A2